MKKAIKITALSLLSLIGLLVVVILVVCWLVLTPARLTPLVEKAADRFLTCQTNFGKVNVTLIRTFPQLGLEVGDITLINPVEGATTDTVASIQKLTLAVDVMDFLKKRDITVKALEIADGKAYLYTSAEGKSNLDIFPKQEQTEEDSSSFDIQALSVDIRRVALRRLSATLDDRSSSLFVQAEDLGLDLKGQLTKGDLGADLTTSLGKALFRMEGETPTNGTLAHLTLQATANKENQSGKGTVCIAADSASFATASLQSALTDLSLSAEASLTQKQWNGKATLEALRPSIKTLGESPLTAQTEQLLVNLTSGDFDGFHIHAIPFVSLTKTNLTIQGEPMLSEAQVSVSGTVDADTTFRFFHVHEGDIQLSPLQVKMDGSLALTDSVHTDFDVHLTSNHWGISEALDLLPRSVRKTLSDIHIRKGGIGLDLTAQGGIREGSLIVDKADGLVNLDHLEGAIGDSLILRSPDVTLTAAIPARSTTKAFHEFMQGTLTTSSINATLLGLGDASLTSARGTYTLSNFLDSHTPFSAKAHLDLAALDAILDTITGHAVSPAIDAQFTSTGGVSPRPHYEATVNMQSFDGVLGQALTANMRTLGISGSATYDKEAGNLMAQWNPSVSLQFTDSHASMASLPQPIHIPAIRMNYAEGLFHIADGGLKIGQSDIHIKGDVTNLDQFLDDKGLLTADLDLSSSHMDVNEILDLVSGLGTNDSTQTAEPEVASAPFEGDTIKQDNPFMVPLGVNVKLRTDIKTAVWNGFDFNGVHGRVTCRDGVLVMEELGFTSKAATMQLTAMYKSPRKNHLFAGLDFHLIDVDIDDLIDMIPAVDTIVPMLKTLDGKAQFHLAGESYLKSNYDLKLSTLRGAAAIEGKDLVVLDNKTFSTIKKYLMTDKQTENKIDSIDLELSVFKDEVDLYPFRVRLGEYEAIVGGRHNINRDLDFDYHISVTDCPLPVRLGLNVSGTLDDMKFNLVSPKYTNLYRPEKRGQIQTRALELKKTINESLKRNVKPVEYYDNSTTPADGK